MDTKHTKRQTNQIRTTNLKPFYKERMKNKSKTTQKDQVEHKNINLKPSYKKMHKKTKGKTTKKRTQTQNCVLEGVTIRKSGKKYKQTNTLKYKCKKNKKHKETQEQIDKKHRETQQQRDKKKHK